MFQYFTQILLGFFLNIHQKSADLYLLQTELQTHKKHGNLNSSKKKQMDRGRHFKHSFCFVNGLITDYYY